MNKELKNIKTTGFKTPDNYFDTIEDNVMDNIKLNNILNSKSTGQTTPEGYFDTIEDSVFQKINSSKKEIKVIDKFEFEVVNNQIANKHKVDYIVKHVGNKGLGNAFKTGVEKALREKADILVNTDGDNQYPGKYILKLIEPILE